MTNNSQIEDLRKKYKDNIISYDEIGMLFNVIDTIDRILKQDNAIFKHYGEKVQMSSLYGVHKETYKNVDVYILFKVTKVGTDNSDYKNVDVEIKEKFIQIYNGVRYFNYNINEVIFYEIRERNEENK